MNTEVKVPVQVDGRTRPIGTQIGRFIWVELEPAAGTRREPARAKRPASRR